MAQACRAEPLGLAHRHQLSEEVPVACVLLSIARGLQCAIPKELGGGGVDPHCPHPREGARQCCRPEPTPRYSTDSQALLGRAGEPASHLPGDTGAPCLPGQACSSPS